MIGILNSVRLGNLFFRSGLKSWEKSRCADQQPEGQASHGLAGVVAPQSKINSDILLRRA
jgi:hypothetical protein